MKFTVERLQFGEIIEAQVTEILSESEVIMSFKGDLLQVQNHSHKVFALGQKLYCRVTALNPLRFEIAQTQLSQPYKMDRFI